MTDLSQFCPINITLILIPAEELKVSRGGKGIGHFRKGHLALDRVFRVVVKESRSVSPCHSQTIA